MKILCIGDSITDMERNKGVELLPYNYGVGYPFYLQGKLAVEHPVEYTVINRGVSGNRITDLYARLKSDCWNLCPDVICCLVGINDLWHEIEWQNGVDPERYERFYRMTIDDTLKRLPSVRFILIEPYAVKGWVIDKYADSFCEIKKYSDIVKRIAEEYGFPFIELQKTFDEYNEKFGSDFCTYDGIHPQVAGSALIAEKVAVAIYELTK